jgi:hypothetical protein
MMTIKYYELTYNSDSVEGRGYAKVAARFVNKEDAVAVCEDPRFWKEHGVMGTRMDPKYDVREVCGPLFESAAAYWTYDEEGIRQAALAKLTDDEKRVLGLPL